MYETEVQLFCGFLLIKFIFQKISYVRDSP